MKYITVNHPDHGEQVVLFPVTMNHRVVADALRMPVVSAGFVGLRDGGAVCHGRSESLDVGCRDGIDCNLVENMVMCGVC